MVKVKLDARPRLSTAGSYKHSLRDQGKIPGIIYGKDMPNKLVEVDVKKLENVLRHGAGRNSIIDLSLEGEKGNKITVMIKDLQRDPVKGQILHADMQKISLKEKINTTVPVHFTGESIGQKKGGIIQSGVRELEVECIPTDLPEHIDVDISTLDIGDSLTVSDLTLAGGCIITSDPSTVVVSIVAPRRVETDLEGVAPEKAAIEKENGEKAATEE